MQGPQYLGMCLDYIYIYFTKPRELINSTGNVNITANYMDGPCLTEGQRQYRQCAALPPQLCNSKYKTGNSKVAVSECNKKCKFIECNVQDVNVLTLCVPQFVTEKEINSSCTDHYGIYIHIYILYIHIYILYIYIYILYHIDFNKSVGENKTFIYVSECNQKDETHFSGASIALMSIILVALLGFVLFTISYNLRVNYSLVYIYIVIKEWTSPIYSVDVLSRMFISQGRT